MSTPVPLWPAAIAGATSPSRIRLTFAPACRSSPIRFSWRSRSSTTTEIARGEIQGKLWPRNDEERQELVDSGYDLDRVLRTDDLVSGQDVFVAATGVTTGALLRGVRYLPNGAITDSIVMRSRSGTVRRIEASHALDKLESFTGREYS